MRYAAAGFESKEGWLSANPLTRKVSVKTAAVTLSQKVAIVLTVAAAVNGCVPQAPAPSAAPLPREYTCDQQRRALADLRTLPATSPVWIWMDDYRVERRQLRALHGLPEPKGCP